jgi:hypothetical protein
MDMDQLVRHQPLPHNVAIYVADMPAGRSTRHYQSQTGLINLPGFSSLSDVASSGERDTGIATDYAWPKLWLSPDEESMSIESDVVGSPTSDHEHEFDDRRHSPIVLPRLVYNILIIVVRN